MVCRSSAASMASSPIFVGVSRMLLRAHASREASPLRRRQVCRLVRRRIYRHITHDQVSSATNRSPCALREDLQRLTVAIGTGDPHAETLTRSFGVAGVRILA